MANNPKAEVEISAHSRGLGAKLQEARAKFGKFGAELKKNIFGKDVGKKDFWSKAGAGLVSNLGSSAVTSSIGFLGDMAREAYHFEDALTRLQITAGKTPEEMAAFSQVVREASDATGLSKENILAAASSFVALTGDMDTATRSTMTWAKIAQATNSTVSDISATAATLTQQMGIVPAQMEEAFAAMAAQGKAGAVELHDLVGLLPQIAPQWKMFNEGGGMKGVREMGAALQVARRGFGSADEAVTGLQALLTAIVKSNALEKLSKHGGIKLFDVDKNGQKSYRDVLEIVQSIGNSKLMKDPHKLEKAFGRVEAYRTFLQLVQNKQALDDLITSSKDAGVIGRDLTTYTTSTAGKLALAGERLKNAIIEAFTPERIQAFANILMRAMDSVKGFMDWVDAHRDLDKDPNFRSNDANEIVDRLKANFRKEHGRDMNRGELGDLAVQMQNIDVNTGAGMPEQLKHLGGNAHSFVGMREAGDVLGRESGAISAGMRVRLADNVTATNEYFTGMGVRSPNVGPDPWAAMGGASGKMDPAEFARTLAKENAAALGPLIAKLTGQPIEVKADGNKLLDVHRHARGHAARPGP